MARAGTRLLKLKGVPGRDRATIREVYRMPNGQTVRLRTNVKRALMTKSVGVNFGDSLVIEGPQDFIGLAIPGPRGTVDCYVIPFARAIDDLRSAHRIWQETQSDGGNSFVRVIYLDDDERTPGHGFARRYADYRVQPTEAAYRTELERVIAEARRTVAAAANRPESAVTISITY